MKTCTICKKVKSHDEFNKRKDSRDGYTPNCKECISFRRKQARVAGHNRKPELLESLEKTDRQKVYLSVILRMKESGIASDHTAREMAARVGGL